MKRLTLEQKALRVIDCLASDDLCEICCYNSAFKRKFTQREAKALADKVTKIYTISHSAIPEHSCFHVHDGQRKDTLSLFRKFKRNGIIPPYKGEKK